MIRIMSSEKFELSQDELDSLLEKLAATLRQISTTSQAEARKRIQQVQCTTGRVKNTVTSVFHCKKVQHIVICLL